MLDEELIQKALEQYKNNLVKYKKIYQIRKQDETFMEANRQRARDYYLNNPTKKKEYYENNKEKTKCKAMYNYYKKIEKIDVFKSKYPERYTFLFPDGCGE